jgi:hypothetical protein
MIVIDDSRSLTSERPMWWIFTEDKWKEWNSQIAARLSEANFTNNNDPESAYSIFYDSIIHSSNEHFRKSNSSPLQRKENRRLWWNKQCYAVIQRARKAYREWRDSPCLQRKEKHDGELKQSRESGRKFIN